MSNKPYSILIVLIGLVFSLNANASDDIGQAKQSILDLIIKSQYAQAMAQTEKLVTDFPSDPCLQDALYLIARQYEWSDKYGNAKAVYQQMIQGPHDNVYTAKAELGAARADVLALILSKNYDQAKKNFDEMAANFSRHPDWPDTLYWVAERYKWAGKYEDAKDFYRKIIRDHPDSPFANRAKLGIPRAEVWFLIRSYNFAEAKRALNKMVADFNDHPDLPETLYGCAEKYRWSDNYEEEKALYQQIMRKYPDSPYAKKAELEFKRASIFTLIISHKYDEAKASLDKLREDLDGSEDLPTALYGIAGRYRWSNQYEEERDIYQEILKRYPDSEYTSKIKLGLARIGVHLLIKAEDFENAHDAFAKLVDEFNDHPDLEDTLYAIARHYGEAGRYEEERSAYQLIIQKYPDSQHKSKAEAGISSRSNALSLATSKDSNGTEEILDKIIADSNENPNLPKTLFVTGEECFEKASRYKKEGRDAEAEEQIRKAIATWKRITEEVPPSAEYAPQAYHRMAYCHFEYLGEYEKAIECCKKVVDSWPDYQYVADVQFSIGNYYERLAYSGIMPESAANPKVEEAYQVVIEKYPDSRNFKYALSKLAELNFKKGQWTKAAYYFEVLLQKYPEDQRPSSIVYKLGRAYEEMGELDRATELYREFMKTAYPTDPLIEDVKTRVEKFDTPSAKNILTDTEMKGIHGGTYGFCMSNGEGCDGPKWCTGCTDEKCTDFCYGPCYQTKASCSGNHSPTKCVDFDTTCVGSTWYKTCWYDLVTGTCKHREISEPCIGTLSSCTYDY